MKLNLKKWLFLILSLSLSQWVSGAEVRVSVKNSIQDFHLMTENAGWVLMGQRLYFTHAKGDTWVEITPNNLNDSAVQAVTFLDTQFGWAVLTKPEENAIAYSVVKTADGGNSWTMTVNDIKMNTPPATIYLHFINPTVGWMVLKEVSSSNFSVGTLYKTTDGGSTWTQLNIPIGEPVRFISETVGWTAGGAAGNELYKTEDGGQTWVSQAVNENTRRSQKGYRFYQLPVFQNTQEGVLPVLVEEEEGSHVEMFSTQDAGHSWKSITKVPLENASTTASTPIAVLDGQHWVVASPSSRSLRASSEDNNEVITKLSMATVTTGWAIQSAGWKQDDLNYASETKLLRTIDGGQTWHDINVPQPTTAEMSFVSAEGRLTRSANRAFQGQGFDKCEIPTLDQLQTWKQESPYQAVNLYMGGISRTCKNLVLTSTYVSEIARQGWQLIPTWVGPQAPWPDTTNRNTDCTPKHDYGEYVDANINNAYNQGVKEANAAMNVAKTLGLTNTIIYYDMEQYKADDSTCRGAVRSFLSGWNATLQSKGYLSGLYTSGSVFRQTTDNLTPQIDAIWVASWYWDSGKGNYTDDATVQTDWINNDKWIGKRIRQYAGGIFDTHGGITLEIDPNVIDGIVVDAYELIANGATGEMQSLNGMGVMHDISDPNAHLTREQAWTLVFRLLAYVKNNQADEKLVDSTMQSTITNLQRPNDYVTRQELLTMFVRALEASGIATSTSKTPPYQDIPGEAVFKEAIVKAYNAGIIGENSNIYPTDPVSRHRFATWGTKFMVALKGEGSSPSTPTTVVTTPTTPSTSVPTTTTEVHVFGTPVKWASTPSSSQLPKCLYNKLTCLTTKYHSGIDFWNSGGDSNIAGITNPKSPNFYVASQDIVVATADGTVVKVNPLGGSDDHGLGNNVIIEHILVDGQKVYSLYAHLYSIDENIQEGVSVSKGQPIGVMGASESGDPNKGSQRIGRNNIHLHFEIKDKPVTHNPHGAGLYWGYMPSNADAYGYHDPNLYLEKMAFLPNKVSFVVNTINKSTGVLQLVSTSLARTANTVTIDGKTVSFTPIADGIKFNTGVLQANLVTPLNIVVKDSNGKELVNTYYPFGDVPPGKLYTNAILQLWKANIVEGQNGMFEGDRNVKRSEFIKMALLATKRGTEFPQTTTSFQDVPKDYWASGYINYAQVNGIASGKDGKFRPEDSIIRAETAKMIVNAVKVSLHQPLFLDTSLLPSLLTGTGTFLGCQFNDVKGSFESYYPVVKQVCQFKIMKGYDDGTFLPGKTLSRIEAAFVACRALNLNNTGLCQ